MLMLQDRLSYLEKKSCRPAQVNFCSFSSCVQEPSESSPWRWRSLAPCPPSFRRCSRTRKDWRAAQRAAGPAERHLAAAAPACRPAPPKAVQPHNHRSSKKLLLRCPLVFCSASYRGFISAPSRRSPTRLLREDGSKGDGGRPSPLPPQTPRPLTCVPLQWSAVQTQRRGPGGRRGGQQDVSERPHGENYWCVILLPSRPPRCSPPHLPPKDFGKNEPRRQRGEGRSFKRKKEAGDGAPWSEYANRDDANWLTKGTQDTVVGFLSMLLSFSEADCKTCGKSPSRPFSSSKTLFFSFRLKINKQISYKRYWIIYRRKVRNYCDWHVRHRMAGWNEDTFSEIRILS